MPELRNIITEAMHDLKAVDVQTIDVSKQTSITDHMIIASGQSDRQVKAIAHKVIETAKLNSFKILGIEGLDQGQWVLIDFGDAIAHIMHPETRDYYQLEKLWSVASQEINEQA